MEGILPFFQSLWDLLTALKTITALITASAIAASGASASVIGTTEGTPITATRHEYCYNNSGLLLGGYNYAPSYTDDEHIGYVKEAGLDFLITAVSEDFLNQCDKFDIGVIAKNYNGPALYYDFKDELMNNWLELSPAAYKDHDCLWGDDMIDEPTSANFERLAAMTNSYYANTTGKIPYINLFPMYASSEQLGNTPDIPSKVNLLLPNSDYSDPSIDQYKRHVSDYINTIDTDYISVDIYPYHEDNGNKNTSNAWLRNVDILAEACRETNRDLWVIVQSTGNILEGGIMRHCDDRYDISQQAYVSLAFGAKAIIYACYQTGWWDTASHLIDSDGNRTATYYAVQEVNRELTAIKDIYGNYSYLGTYLMNEYKCAGQQYGLYNGLKDSDKADISSFDGLITGCFKANSGNGKAYIVANMEQLGDNSSASFTAKFPEGSTVTVYRKGVAQVMAANSVAMTLDCGEGVFITVE